MKHVAATFLSTCLLAAALTALGLFLSDKGYAFGDLGVARLGEIARPATFLPLAAIYSLSALLMMLLPLRAAGFVHTNAAIPIQLAAVVLLASIVGVVIARAAFGGPAVLWALSDWRLVAGVAIIVAHLLMSLLRRDILLRSFAFVAFAAATLACLYWTFEL